MAPYSTEKDQFPPPPEQAENAIKNDDGTVVSSPNEDDKKTNDVLASTGEVFSFIRNKKMIVKLIVGLFFSIVSGVTNPAMAWIFSSSFTNFAVSPGSAGFLANIRTLAFSLMALGAISLVSLTLQATFMELFASEMATVMKEEWFAALMRQDMAYYDIMDVSGTATIISVNGKKFKKGLGRKLGEGVQYSVTFVGGLAFAFWASWKLSLLLLCIIPFMVLSTALLLKQNQTKTARANESYARAGSIVYSTVSAIRTILSLNAIEQVIAAFKEATQEAYDGAVSQVFLLGVANASVMGSFLLGYLPLILYGSYLLYTAVSKSGCDPSDGIPNNETCDPSAFDVFGALMGITFAGAVVPQVATSLECFIGSRSACYPALVAINRKRDDKDTPETASKNDIPLRRGSAIAALPKYLIDSSSPDGLKPNSVIGEIVFKDVQFCYPSRLEVKVFDGFNLAVKAGTTVALVGPSGGGKSTVVQLLERFYDPTLGSITLDGHDLKDLNVQWLRQQIGLVSQEPKLFAGSILENIRIGRPNATIEEIHDAAKKSNCHDFIMSFTKGYDTDAGDEGGQLSGGQKQRIAIARTLLMDPKIILLDEATSALDSESEVIVQEALDKLMEDTHKGAQKRTVIVIAHRLSTIRNADMIAVVSGGKIIETGKHEELIAREGAYFQLVEAQKGKKSNSFRSESGELSRSSSVSEAMSAAVDETESKVVETDDSLITFEDVHFHYPSRPEQQIFRGLNLTVKKGETLAIVGPSGQGKSTVIQLIERFYLPTKGAIKYKGVDFNDVNVGWLHTQVGLVGQEPRLFDLTIADNIRFGMPHATMEQVIQAAKEANADGFIRSFPDGYQTMVGSSSSTQVSGGQKQRIAIARALIRNPKILLLDEATSALDSESERIVQDALDQIVLSSDRTTIVIAHRLSTIRNATRIVVINDGKVRETGTHDELLALDGHYKRLVALQDLDSDAVRQGYRDAMKANRRSSAGVTLLAVDKDKLESDGLVDDSIVMEKENARKARNLAKGDEFYFFIGALGAVFAGLMFPGWGFMFAYMIKVLYYPVFFCDESMEAPPPPEYETCQEYWDASSEEMRELSFKVAYGLLGIMACALIGHTLVHVGFGTATERMNKRVRDVSFCNLVRQEVAYFDMKPVAVITSELSEDAAMIHAFSGEPIRTFVMNVASVVVGLVVSFIYMWPFALVVLGILPFMVFGAAADTQMWQGEDESSHDMEEQSSGRIIIESLTNIRTVASLSLEDSRKDKFKVMLQHEDPHPFRTNIVKGSTYGLGQFCQMWGMALMYWWGGWLLYTYPNVFPDADAFLISMFTLLFALSGTGAATHGLTDKNKAQAAADRIFTLMERPSQIDPLATTGKKDL